VHTVARFLREHKDIPVVLDPVAVDIGGLIMQPPETIDVICKEFIPRATLITPNRREAALLADMEECLTTEDMEIASKRIFENYGTPVVITGGGLGNKSVHVYCGMDGLAHYEAEFHSTGKHYGGGSIYAAAITSQIAQGEGHREAIPFALHYVNGLPSPALLCDRDHPTPLFPQPSHVDHHSTGAYATIPDVTH
jgi:hydroxymethylpyrimidine/phosphomethylpyrimidine kinase